MDKGIEQQRTHLKSLETILEVGAHDQVNHDELVKNIAKQKENIARLEGAEKSNEKVKIKTQTEPIEEVEALREYPYSPAHNGNGIGQSAMGSTEELRNMLAHREEDQ